jgi:hypothetical protein
MQNPTPRSLPRTPSRFAEKMRTTNLRHEGDAMTAPRFLKYFGGLNFVAAKAHVLSLFAAVAARSSRTPPERGGPPEIMLDVDLTDTDTLGISLLALSESLFPFDDRERMRADIEHRLELEAGLRDR